MFGGGVIPSSARRGYSLNYTQSHSQWCQGYSLRLPHAKYGFHLRVLASAHIKSMSIIFKQVFLTIFYLVQHQSSMLQYQTILILENRGILSYAQ